MARTVMVGQLTTGLRLTQLPVTAATFDSKLNVAEQLSATLKLDAPALRRRPELMMALEPARSFMAVLEGDTVLGAGPIWSHDYDDVKKQLVIRGAGIRSVFDYRIVMKTLAAGENPALSKLAFSGALADIARDLVRQALAGGALPIVVVGADEGGTEVRTYNGFDLGRVSDRLKELTGVLGGPDIEFRGRLSDSRQALVWDMLTGTAADPLLHQPGSGADGGPADHVWDSQVPNSGITALSVTRDASRMAGAWYSTGQGMGEALEIRTARDTDRESHGWPLLEGSSSYPTAEDLSTLDVHASTELLGKSRPWTTWTLSARADRTPRLGTYRCGDWARVWVSKDHPYLPHILRSGGDEYYRTRITGFSGSLKPTVQISMAPTMEER